MVFLIHPNIMFSNFGKVMLICVTPKSRLLGPSFRCCSRSFITSNALFEVITNKLKPTVNFNTIPTLLKNKNGTLYSSNLDGKCLSSSSAKSVLIMSRSLLVQSRISSMSHSSVEQRRHKTSKKSPKRPEHDSDSDSDEDDEEPIEGTKVLSVRLQSLRTDGILKKALNVARNKVETAFYEGHIRVNGEKPMKKSQQLKIGDEVDLIRGVSPVNPDLLNISRVEVLSVKEGDESDELSVKIRRTKTLYIENYVTDPWKKGSIE